MVYKNDSEDRKHKMEENMVLDLTLHLQDMTDSLLKSPQSSFFVRFLFHYHRAAATTCATGAATI